MGNFGASGDAGRLRAAPWALNWLNIPFAVVGAIISSVALGRARAEPKGMSIAGLVCCGIAIVFGLIRLVFGFGVI